MISIPGWDTKILQPSQSSKVVLIMVKSVQMVATWKLGVGRDIEDRLAKYRYLLKWRENFLGSHCIVHTKSLPSHSTL